MAIKPRSAVPAAARPARRAAPPHVRRPPTQGQLSGAVYRLLDELAKGRDVSQATIDEMAAEVYGFATKSVETAWSVVDAAVVVVRCLQGRRRISGVGGDVVAPFKADLDKAKKADLDRADAIRKEIAKEEDEAVKAAKSQELRELLLRDAQPGSPLRLGPAATDFLREAMVRWFRPVEGSPLAWEDLPRMVVENRRFFDFLAVQVLFGGEEAAAYAAAKDADKAARVAADSEPAPPAEEEAPAAVPAEAVA